MVMVLLGHHSTTMGPRLPPICQLLSRLIRPVFDKPDLEKIWKNFIQRTTGI
jgi:hypothetical protein